MTPQDLKRFWSKVDMSDLEGCWLWTGAKISSGYGSFRVNGKSQLAHRLSYSEKVAVIPEGKVIDHICHKTSCVRPDHLRVVSPKQNSENLSGPHRDSRSGVRGVYRKRGKWCVRVMSKGVNYRGGTFTDLKDAELAAVELRNLLFTCNDKDRKLK